MPRSRVFEAPAARDSARPVLAPAELQRARALLLAADRTPALPAALAPLWQRACLADRLSARSAAATASAATAALLLADLQARRTAANRPHRAHWQQPLDYNALHGGLEPGSNRLEAELLAQPAWAQLCWCLAGNGRSH